MVTVLTPVLCGSQIYVCYVVKTLYNNIMQILNSVNKL